MNLPNILTLLRICLIPLLVLFFYVPGITAHYITAAIFGIAAMTDWLDGFLARVLNQTSRFGEFLDPVADKLIVSIALVLLVGRWGAPWIAIPAAIIIGREIAISALREWMAEIGQAAQLKVSNLAKIKTVAQMAAIFIFLAQPEGGRFGWLWIGGLLLYGAAILTLWSMFLYLQAAWSSLKKK